MLTQLLAIALAGAQAPPPALAPAQGLSPVAPQAAPAVGVADKASQDELKRLQAELPKSINGPALLNVGEIAGAMDYPKDALENDQQGTVGVWVLVGPDGRAVRCGVEKSSGAPVLDAQTCDLFVAKGKFRAAQDKRGRTVAGLHHQQMVWRLEGETSSEKLSNQIARETFIVSPEGMARSCKSEFRSADGKWIEGPKERCTPFLAEPTALLRAAREKSKLHDAEVVMEVRVSTDPAAIQPVAQSPGEVLVFLRNASMTFAVDGKRTSCTKGEGVGFEGYKDDPCADPKYAQVPDPILKAGVVSQVRLLWAIYLKGEPK